MFDDILRGLDGIPEQQTINVDVVLDDDGYYDRTCPAPECGNGLNGALRGLEGQGP